MSRYYSPITVKQLKKKIDKELSEVVDPGFDHNLPDLTDRITRDLSCIDFDRENVSTPYETDYDDSGKAVLIYDPNGVSFGDENNVGYHTTPNGLSYLGMEVGGDWENPVFMIIYWSGTELRGYIPKKGNSFNPKFKSAWGNNEENLQGPELDYPKMISDIDHRIINKEQK